MERLDALRDRAAKLPMEPGVYLMKDKSGTVIYVGKAKKLKNRVSQYFQDTSSHSPKTRVMVSKVDHFDVIVAASEFEALVLECAQIKKYMPRYNILLKDDKGYPYVRMDMSLQYPVMSIVNQISDDGAEYFGPFGSRGVTKSVLDAIRSALRLSDCSRVFPRDLGKERPCLNYHMNQCAGWCTGTPDCQEYRKSVEFARQLLQGHYKPVANQIRKQMLEASEQLNFELAASLRDQLQSIENLNKKQLVTAGSAIDTDVLGFAHNGEKACFSVLHYQNGELLDKEYIIINAADDAQVTLESLIKQYYLESAYVPKTILLPMHIVDGDLIADMLSQKQNRRVHIRVPQRGDNARLIALAVKNAQEELNRVVGKDENRRLTLKKLASMLQLSSVGRIESFDISNISGTDTVASMVVFQDGKPRVSAYKRFKIEGLSGQDDYEAMRQAVSRRYRHYLNSDAGFDILPDLLLIDGGINHANVVAGALDAMGISLPIFGMVKDDRHRTRALVTPSGAQINIDANQAVFSLVGNIQEETHRFAITYHKKLRSKRLHKSILDQIPGIGPKRKQELLMHFKSVAAIKEASVNELKVCLPDNAAINVYRYFRGNEEEKCE